MDWKTTSTVLDRLYADDGQSAWDLLVGHFRDTIVRFGERAGLTRADAQDAAQETLVAFVQAFRRGRYDRSKGRLKSWLFGIAQRQILSVRQREIADRARRQSSGSGPGLEEELVDEAGMVDVWEDVWRRTIYARSLEQVQGEVTPQTFEIFRALVFDERPTEEICERFAISRTKVYNVKHRVTKRLAELVRQYEDA